MASGNVNRANRPNTWLLRPLLQSEDSSCQPGAVHTWPLAGVPLAAGDVRFWGNSRHALVTPWSAPLEPDRLKLVI